jgi:hypothetical protein
MSDTLLIGRGGEISEMPQKEWEQELSQAPAHVRERLGFMSAEHHLLRNLVVRELPGAGGPLPAEFIWRRLGLPQSRVAEILDDLEHHLFFLVRNDAGAVSWAFPVTADNTGHHLVFSTGERLDAA